MKSAEFLTRQVDWINSLRRAVFDRYARLCQRRADLSTRLRWLRRFRTVAKSVPAPRRDAAHRSTIVQFHVSRAALRRVTRQLRDVARAYPECAA